MFVLVHGIGVSHRYFTGLHDELARRGEVHSVDLPGFGGLPKPEQAPSVPQMAAMLRVVLDRLGLGVVTLVGQSMGAEWVVALAALRPAEQTAGVVLIGPVVDEEHRTIVAQSRALALDILLEPLRANAVVLQDYLRCGPAWFLRESRHMVDYSIEDGVADLAMPVLVIRGGQDPIAGTAFCRRLRDRAPRGGMAVVPGHHHLVQFTAPRAVASAVRQIEAIVGVPR